jgi:tetratricopeptide (TPR) repeat protein
MDEAARPYFERGAAAYDAGMYPQAIEAFERGQRLDPHPDFLYALAQAYRKQGDCTRAIALYQAFLATRPPDEEAARARSNLERCPLGPPAASAAPASPPRDSPPSPPPEPVEPPWYTDLTGDVLGGAGLVGIGIGTTYLILADRSITRANDATTLAQAERLADSASREHRIGAWSLAGGGALALGAILRYALHRRSSRPDRTVWVTPRADAVVVSWGGRF